MNQQIEHILSVLEPKMKKERFQHTVGVMYTAANLAFAHGADMEKAMIAGALHDCAKRLDIRDYVSECKKVNLPIREIAYETPHLLHADLGAYFAKEQFGILDAEILHAIQVHTTGCPKMTLLDKILYVADYIEPERKPFDGLEEIRKAAYENLNQAVFLESENVIQYITNRGFQMDPLTLETYHYYENWRNL